MVNDGVDDVSYSFAIKVVNEPVVFTINGENLDSVQSVDYSYNSYISFTVVMYDLEYAVTLSNENIIYSDSYSLSWLNYSISGNSVDFSGTPTEASHVGSFHIDFSINDTVVTTDTSYNFAILNQPAVFKINEQEVANIQDKIYSYNSNVFLRWLCMMPKTHSQ